LRFSPIRRTAPAHKLGTGVLLLLLLAISTFMLLPAASSMGQTEEQLESPGPATGLEVGTGASQRAETNPAAAEGVELSAMTREGAGELLEGVFEAQLGAVDAGLVT
jgi:hypothetical protein